MCLTNGAAYAEVGLGKEYIYPNFQVKPSTLPSKKNKEERRTEKAY
jgi:hypothetical protein